MAEDYKILIIAIYKDNNLMDSKSLSKPHPTEQGSTGKDTPLNNPESQGLTENDGKSKAQALQEVVDKEARAYAKKVLKIKDEDLLQGRMSDALIQTINEAKLKHRSSKLSSLIRARSSRFEVGQLVPRWLLEEAGGSLRSHFARRRPKFQRHH